MKNCIRTPMTFHEVTINGDVCWRWEWADVPVSARKYRAYRRSLARGRRLMRKAARQ